MTKIMKTLIFLNIQGSVLVILLILLKGVIGKTFSGKWQRNLWVYIAVMFLIPVWKVVPDRAIPPIIAPYYAEELSVQDNEIELSENPEENIVIHDVSVVSEKFSVNAFETVWHIGITAFLILNVLGYVVFLIRKRKISKIVVDVEFMNILHSMGIKRKIRLRKCEDTDSPMLTGILFPIVYIPKNNLTVEELRYVYTHELMHYKHKDLFIKWLVCIINAINWFNPCMYFVIKNLNEACEIYCDEAVTKNMDDNSKREYMNTILNLVENKGENYVQKHLYNPYEREQQSFEKKV